MATTASHLLKNTEIQPQKIFNFDDFCFPFSSNHVDHKLFSETIKLFLHECAEIADHEVCGMRIWSTSLIKEVNREVFPIYIVEESVQSSVNPFCVHCKSAGWSHHFVSKKKYHLIIPARDRWNTNLEEHFSESRSHTLYGLIHCNGYGHLLCINGLGEENDFFNGGITDVMNFWDRICSVLNTRKISIIDSFKKGSMDMRLIHGLAFGQTRFGRWGYKLVATSSGVTEEDIRVTIKYLSSLPFEKVIDRLKNKSEGKNNLNAILCKYRNLSKNPLITISDFVKVLLMFKLKNPTVNEDTYEYESKRLENSGPIKLTTLAEILARRCRWAARRIEVVLMVIANELEKYKDNSNGNHGISRHTLREETRKCVGDTGLIDFVLKSITSFKKGNHVIRRSINSSTKKYEFKIHKIVNELEHEHEPEPFGSIWPDQTVEHAAQVIVNMLESNVGNNPISPLELHKKATERIGDKRLINYALNLINNSIIESHVLYPPIKRVNLTLHDVIKQAMTTQTDAEDDDDNNNNAYEDLLFIYKTLVFGLKKSDRIRSAIGILIYSKHFEKEWIIKEQDNDQLMTLICKVLPSFDELEKELTKPLSPGVIIKVHSLITISELKAIIEVALRDTYCIMNKFVINQIGGLKAIEDDRVLSNTFKHGDLVWVRGCGLDFDTKMRYEGGPSRI